MTVASGANDFAFQLSAALAKESDNENFVCSPYSVWIPLAALVNATDTHYKDSLLEVLNPPYCGVVNGQSEAKPERDDIAVFVIVADFHT